MRFALIIEYDGTNFHGWQSQLGLRTIQDECEKALSKVANAPIQVTCAGRTDKGVHAKHQVIHFDTSAERTLHAWFMGMNHFLPPDISARKALAVAEDFHARYGAVSRTYEYWIDNRSVSPAIMRHYVTWHPQALDHTRMHTAAQALLGEHDFNAYRAAECQAKHAIRNIQQIEVKRQEHFVILTVTANAFLHHMIRNIMGVLLPIGMGKKSVDWTAEVLASQKRAEAGVTAPPQGLYLCDVQYPNYSLLST